MEGCYPFSDSMKTPVNNTGAVRWGIIGCGDVTEIKSGPAFQRAVGSELVAVMRRNGALAADYARRHGVSRWYDDARALVNDPEVDAVYVATPPNAHLECALLAAAAGKPAYVEKPMARNAAECEVMIRAFRDAGLPLYVAYYRRELPRCRKVQELLSANAIGVLTGVSYRFASPVQSASEGAWPWRLSAEVAGAGLFLDLGSHLLDLLDLLVGPVSNVAGTAANIATPMDVEDTVAMTFRTASGAPGAASWNFASALNDDVLELSGTTGRVSLSIFGNEPVKLETGGGLQTFDLPNPPHVHQPLVQTIVDELLGRGICASTGDSALRSSVIMDHVLSGYYGGRGDAFWTRPASWPGRRK